MKKLTLIFTLIFTPFLYAGNDDEPTHPTPQYQVAIDTQSIGAKSRQNYLALHHQYSQPQELNQAQTAIRSITHEGTTVQKQALESHQQKVLANITASLNGNQEACLAIQDMVYALPNTDCATINKEIKPYIYQALDACFTEYGRPRDEPLKGKLADAYCGMLNVVYGETEYYGVIEQLGQNNPEFGYYHKKYYQPRGAGDKLAQPARLIGYALRQEGRALYNRVSRKSSTANLEKLITRINNHPRNKALREGQADQSSTPTTTSSQTNAAVQKTQSTPFYTFAPELITEETKVAQQLEKTNPEAAYELRALSAARQEMHEKMASCKPISVEDSKEAIYEKVKMRLDHAQEIFNRYKKADKKDQGILWSDLRSEALREYKEIAPEKFNQFTLSHLGEHVVGYATFAQDVASTASSLGIEIYQDVLENPHKLSSLEELFSHHATKACYDHFQKFADGYRQLDEVQREIFWDEMHGKLAFIAAMAPIDARALSAIGRFVISPAIRNVAKTAGAVAEGLKSAHGASALKYSAEARSAMMGDSILMKAGKDGVYSMAEAKVALRQLPALDRAGRLPLPQPKPGVWLIQQAEALEKTRGLIKKLGKESCHRSVWNKIEPTQEIWNPHTKIPKSFTMEVNNNKLWIHPNASEHLMELTSPKESLRMYHDPLRSPFDIPAKEYKFAHEILLEDLHSALEEATKNGIKYNELLVVNNWELKIGMPKFNNGNPVVFHARPIKL